MPKVEWHIATVLCSEKVKRFSRMIGRPFVGADDIMRSLTGNKAQILDGLKRLADKLVFEGRGVNMQNYVSLIVSLLVRYSDTDICELCTLCLRNAAETESLKFSQMKETKVLEVVVQIFNVLYGHDVCRPIIENCIHFIGSVSRRMGSVLGTILSYDAVFKSLDGSLGNVEKRMLMTIILNITQSGSIPAALRSRIQQLTQYVDSPDSQLANLALNVTITIAQSMAYNEVPTELVTVFFDHLGSVNNEVLSSLLSCLALILSGEHTAKAALEYNVDFEALFFSPKFPNFTESFQKSVANIVIRLLPGDKELKEFGVRDQDGSEENIAFARKIQPLLLKLILERPLAPGRILVAFAITLKYQQVEPTENLIMTLTYLSKMVWAECIAVICRFSDPSSILRRPSSTVLLVPVRSDDEPAKVWAWSLLVRYGASMFSSNGIHPPDYWKSQSLESIIALLENGKGTDFRPLAGFVARFAEVLDACKGPPYPAALGTLRQILLSLVMPCKLRKDDEKSPNLKDFIDILSTRIHVVVQSDSTRHFRVPLKDSLSLLGGLALVGESDWVGPLKTALLSKPDLAYYICGQKPIDQFPLERLRFEQVPLIWKVFITRDSMVFNNDVSWDESLIRYCLRFCRPSQLAEYVPTITFRSVKETVRKSLHLTDKHPGDAGFKCLATLAKMGFNEIFPPFVSLFHASMAYPFQSLGRPRLLAGMFLRYPFLFPFEERVFALRLMACDLYTGLRLLVKEFRSCDKERIAAVRPAPLGLTVRRYRLFEDGLVILDNFLNNGFCVEIEFEGEVGVGMGPTREFFLLMAMEFQKSERALFRNEDTSKEFVTNHQGLFPSLSASPSTFRLLGVFVAKAISMSICVGMDFNPAFFKLAQKETVTLSEIDDALARSLVSHEGLIGLDYSYPGYPDYQLDGMGAVIDEGNVAQFVHAIETETINNATACAQSFVDGFCEVMAFDYLKMFSAQEISRLVSGDASVITMDDLERYVDIGSGYTKDSPQIAMLFSILTEMEPAGQKDFIRFVTGSELLPVGGLKSLDPRMQIEKRETTGDDGGNFHLPTASTCTCRLKLPAYADRQVMKDKLLFAINHCREFLLS